MDVVFFRLRHSIHMLNIIIIIINIIIIGNINIIIIGNITIIIIIICN